VTWTSPEPRGVVTARTVDMRGGIVGNEEFLAWEPFTRMAFRFNECSSRGHSAGFCATCAATPTPGTPRPRNVRSMR
jgi:hypothetical protein